MLKNGLRCFLTMIVRLHVVFLTVKERSTTTAMKLNSATPQLRNDGPSLPYATHSYYSFE